MGNPDPDPPTDPPNPGKTSPIQPTTTDNRQPKITFFLTPTTAHPSAKTNKEKTEKMTTNSTKDTNDDDDTNILFKGIHCSGGKVVPPAIINSVAMAYCQH